MITFKGVAKSFNKTPEELRKIIKGQYKIKITGFLPFTAEIEEVQKGLGKE